MTDNNIYNGIENKLGNAIYSNQNLKSYTGQLLAIQEINEMKELIQKDILNQSDLRRMKYLLSGSEQKLLNYSDKERYGVGRFLTWENDFINIPISLLKQINQFENDYKVLPIEEIRKARNAGKDTKRMITPLTLEALLMAYTLLDEDIKYLVGVHLYISRSSLSLKGVGFDSLGKNRNETIYSGGVNMNNQTQQPGVLNWGVKK